MNGEVGQLDASSGTAPARTAVIADTPAPTWWRSALGAGWPAFLAAVPAVAVLIGITFQLFPWLGEPEFGNVRHVAFTDMKNPEGVGTPEFVERTSSSDGTPVSVVFFQVEATGYNVDDLAVASVWIDPESLRRVDSNLIPHGRLMEGRRADGELMPQSDADVDRMIGWIEVPDPLGATDGGCLFLRVFIYDQGDGPLPSTPDDNSMFSWPFNDDDEWPWRDRPTLVLAYADTAQIDLKIFSGTRCPVPPTATQ